ncbi:hypothetical protein AVEN_13134-1 [Araneus ventricosus]|uniref:Uncharacterized protein n=1 Tax=Araneus ventricosus TaxID=182803 RepID=A0A4Y2DMN7_ARAVE|nr:hypothetical protein AVEN_1717-1 [Araneus ventricosus]GBM18073.1 hypothetical protein AVEN_217822-1 [Araneus ventricosus]GBM22335.1 hypothetical protein AVEN_12071-1 [Araneus ventricosus]GBM22344.1 hypothetical protein AVEN_133089-1 [Araneus ventricosus]GBM45542.1 hypothetical protein AVEN_13134-1 [Araneus ventricosus]
MSWSLFDESQPFGNVIYTDGSKIQNRVGCASVHFQENDEIFSELFRLSHEATVFMAPGTLLSMRQAKIISDSRSAIMSLASVHEKRVIINEIKDNLNKYLWDIQLIWIRGFEGNERADHFAKMASIKDHVDFSFCPSRIQIKIAARIEILDAWQQR